MNVDTIRMTFTYLIATLVLIGAFLLVWQKLADISAEALLALVTFVAGAVLGFVFNRESTIAGQRSAERAVTLGANTANTITQ